MPKLVNNGLLATVTPKFRQQHGIAPKGRGPHRAEDYGLPVPPADHVHAKALARATLGRAMSALAHFPIVSVVQQVRKANTILYGTPTPTAKEKEAGRAARHAIAQREPHHQHEAAARAMREAFYDAAPPAGSWEATQKLILDAARESMMFGGPVVPYSVGEPEGSDFVRPYDIQIAVSYPQQSSVVISNGKTGDMWVAPYSIADDVVTFANVQPAQLQVVAKAQEALRLARESGKRHVRHQLLKLEHPLLETEVDVVTGVAHVMIIREGPGNLADRHWYTGDSLRKAVEQRVYEGARNFLDHPSPTEEEQQPGRSVEDMGGWFNNVTLGTFDDPDLGAVAAIYADFHPQVGHDLTINLLRTCAEYSAAFPGESYVGLSINAFGVGAPAEINGEQWNQVDLITEVMSVDTVTRAGAKGRIISFQESLDRMKTGTAAKPRREAFTDPNVEFDIRTRAERQTDVKKAREAFRKRVREGALRGPNGIRFLEAVGYPPADAAKAAPAANNGAIPKLNAQQDQQLDSMLGLVDGGPLDELLDTAMGGNDDATGETTEAGSGVNTLGDPAAGGAQLKRGTDGKLVPLTDEEIAAMTPEALQTYTKLLQVEATGAAPATGTGAAAAGGAQPAVHESAAFQVERTKRIAAENALREARGELTDRTKGTIADRIIEQMKVPANFVPVMKRHIVGAKDETQMVEMAREWAGAFIGESHDGAGIPGTVRENAATGLFVPAMS